MKIMKSLDTDFSDYVDYTEFLAGCMKSKLYLNEENLKAAFAYFDKVSQIVKDKYRDSLY